MKFDVVDLLTSTVKILWKHKSIWALILVPIVIAFLPFIVFFVPLLGLMGFGPDPNMLDMDTISSVFFLAFLVVFVISALVNLFASAASNASASLGIIRAERGEGSTNFMILIRESFPYFWRILGVMLVIGLTIGLVFTVISFLSFALIAVTIGMAAICLQPLYILMAPLMYLMMGIQDAAQIAVITEDMSVMDAIKHAFQVVREHVWKYILISLVIYFGGTILSTFIVFPVMIPMFAAFPLIDAGSLTESQSAGVIVGFMMCFFFPAMLFISSIIGALMKTALGLTYLRLAPSGQKTENQVIFSEP